MSSTNCKHCKSTNLLQGIVSGERFRHAVNIVSIVNSTAIVVLSSHSHSVLVNWQLVCIAIDRVGWVVPACEHIWVVVASHAADVDDGTFHSRIVPTVGSTAEVRGLIHVKPQTIIRNSLLKLFQLLGPPVERVGMQKVRNVGESRPYLGNVITIPSSILEVHSKLSTSCECCIVLINFDSCRCKCQQSRKHRQIL